MGLKAHRSFARRTPHRHVVWGVGASVNLMTMIHRSSLAVAGLVAADRFNISATELATFTVVQLAVYLAMQLPAGIFIDRLGPRVVLAAALAVQTVAQAVFAVAPTYSVALVARAFVGLGDAAVFISVLRLIAATYEPRGVPVASQALAVSGQSAVLIATVPMAAALDEFGWTNTYLATSALGLIPLAVLLVVVPREPVAAPREPLHVRDEARRIAEVWSHPGTRLAFWAHFSSPFVGNTMTLLWGYPFLIYSQDIAAVSARLLVSSVVISAVAAGFPVAVFVRNRPRHRSLAVMAVSSANFGTWVAVLAWQGPAPAWLIGFAFALAGIGVSVSMIAFDIVRTFNGGDRQGTAAGLVNQGGFVATLTCVLLVGAVLDLVDGGKGRGGAYSPMSFRLAMLVVPVVLAIGTVQVLRYRLKVRAHLTSASSALSAN